MDGVSRLESAVLQGKPPFVNADISADATKVYLDPHCGLLLCMRQLFRLSTGIGLLHNGKYQARFDDLSSIPDFLIGSCLESVLWKHV